MENMEESSGGGGEVAAAEGRAHAGGGGSRWNPSKEQISMLEGFYMQGVRTPNAEQIEVITSRLREYGNVEGKNVFYWFQNHKARQRQKQKQESLVAYNSYLQHYRFLHHFCHQPSPLFPPPPPNVVYSPPYYGQQPAMPSNNKVLLPAAKGTRRKPRAEAESKAGVHEKSQNNIVTMHAAPQPTCDEEWPMSSETLPLFPVHPTGVLDSARRSNE